MTPPQAPPAYVSSSQQEAVDAFDRLLATRSWLIAQEPFLPEVTAAHATTSASATLDELTAFWDQAIVDAPGTLPVARWSVFGQRLRAAMRDEATLRVADGTLSEGAARLAHAFTRSRAEHLAGIEVSELLAGDVAFAGGVVIAQSGSPGPVILFTPDRGWEEFIDLATLCRRTEARVREALAAGRAPETIMRDDIERVLDAPFVTARRMEADPMLTVVNRILALQRERVALYWEGLRATDGDHAANRYIASRLRPSLSLRGYLDVTAILTHRDIALTAALADERLAAVPDAVRRDWREAYAAYATTLQTAERRRLSAGVREVRPLDDVARDTVAGKLRALGIDAAPDDVEIAVRDGTPSYFLAPTPAIAASRLPRARETLTLTELALRNAGPLDSDLLMAREVHGRPLPASFFNGGIRALVREADVGRVYRAHLRDVLFDAPDAKAARAIAGDVLRARMRFDAETMRLGDFLPDAPRGFRDGQANRGYLWVRAALDAPVASPLRAVAGHDVVVSHFTYEGERLRDVLIIGPRASGSMHGVVFYTPGAPDAVSFREFASRKEALAALLGDARLRAYLLDRMPVANVAQAPNGSGRLFHASSMARTANWAWSGTDTHGATPAAFGEEEIAGDFTLSAYDVAATILIKDVDAAARTTADAVSDTFSPRVDGEAIARGIAGMLGRPFVASWQAYDSIKAGDPRQAFLHATDAWVASLDFAGLALLQRGVPRALGVRAARGSRELLPVRPGAQAVDAAFPERFVASGVSVRDAASVSHGVYTIRGRQYIEQGQKLYGVRRDGQGWRLAHPDAPTWSPFIQRHADGRWDYLGLKGGFTGNARAWVDIADPALTAELTFDQRRVFEEALIARTGIDEARRITRQVNANATTGPYVRLSEVQEEHWRASLSAARRAPAVRPRPAAAAAAAPGRAAATVQGFDPADFAQPAVLERLDPARWPAHVWYYPSAGTPFPTRTGDSLVLAQSRQAAHGSQGVGALASGPLTPWARLGATPGGPTLAPGVRPAVFEWVRIEMETLRRRLTPSGQPPVNVYAVRQGNHVSYLLRPTDATDDAATLWLQRGEFDTGIGFATGLEADGAVAGPSRAPARGGDS